jgi:DNA-binding MarR family transcriptional regulator
MNQQRTIDPELPEILELRDLIHEISHISKVEMMHEMADFQITLAQFNVLRCMEFQNGETSISKISHECQAVLPTMSGILERLEVRGLVRRSRDPNDRRSFLVSITPEGQALLDKIKRAHTKQIESFMIGISASERKTFIRLLDQYLNNLKTRADQKLEDNIE